MRLRIFFIVLILCLLPKVCSANIGATCVWEMRTTGSNTAGGGYTSGGTDYSQQDAAELTLTDLACTTGGVVLTSTTGGFIAGFVGNVIQITAGTNFTTGWYEITVYTDTNTVELDRDPTNGSNASSGTGNIGGALALPTDALYEQSISGQIFYIKAGTYNLAASVSVSATGMATLPVTIEGYNSSRGDNPTGDNRPLIAAGAYSWIFDSHWILRNLRMTTTHSNGFRFDQHTMAENCKSVNSSGSGGREAFTTYYQQSHLINCEGESTAGNAVLMPYSTHLIFGCYLHDSVKGILMDSTSHNNIISFNIIDTCSTAGIEVASGDHSSIINNTIYNCGIGISGTDGANHMVLNNIIDTCTTGADWTTEQKANWFDYNNWKNNTADTSNVTKGDNALALDPTFTNAGSADFRIGTNLKSAAFPGLFGGAHASCEGHLDTGAVQREEAGGTDIFGWVD